MWSSKDVYYISDSTGILATNLGQALICQFPEINFHEEKFPFVLNKEEAKKILDYILKKSSGRRPLIFSTIMTKEIRAVFDSPEVELFDAFEFFMTRLEDCLEAKALGVPGFSRHIDNLTMAKRVEAIHYCLEHDDGVNIHELDEAEVILLGVSRSGKTPVSVYLATQMGMKSANFPLTSEYLSAYTLPEEIIKNRKRAIGLTTTPEVLHSVREKRYADSNYAKRSTCSEEIQTAETIFHNHQIPIVSTAGKSIEEVATQVSQELGLSKKPTSLNEGS
ncbi:MAG: pyruvate, water dikinase regulatory protein [Desulfurivibrionaceae bacterium]|jgi:regulator of PEP synthase PpsR (kinase-PPPase family)|nr:pyruvate, phosphate dikinase/phosphoenolpyruvate synthase regulator [Pseudomonadota bacterium]MCG2823025.1 pyruvate, phosphate dikinase/phosphoenolpyruvate synthase regulator [Desulfobulbaceae bacterium]MDP2758751.1 pyruvate, phosphate dikinase/phosphoenolpyruvate synthase regulator [Desulfurivibrionaceae bacterium]PKN21700.1 MAG: phosphoenolpyruvate synthase regulatory protein [Deltaproteobacteria bacterium HGW-Deltaproteobacteria-3]MBU4230411.1 pyruvate, phosphate dikinase/phosphoenolpyruv